MVKFGAVRNYIVGIWSQQDVDACADLNLPCADVSAFLAEPLDNASNAGSLSNHDYNVSRRLLMPCLAIVCLCRPPLCAACRCSYLPDGGSCDLLNAVLGCCRWCAG
jgi:hypothetical protein